MNLLSLGLTIFFGILSVVLSVILFLESKHRKNLTFTHTSTGLYTRRHPDITIAFKGKQIENLSRLRVVIWNSGNQEIRGADIPAGGEPSITLTGAMLRSVAILDSSPDIRCSAVERGEQTVSVGFEFLNPRDYATLDVLYESEDQSPKIEYTARIIGGQSDSRQFLQPTTPVSWVGPVGLGLIAGVGMYAWLRAVRFAIYRVPPHGFGIKIGDFWSLVAPIISRLTFRIR